MPAVGALVRHAAALLVLALVLVLTAAGAEAQTSRLVVIKADGLPFDAVDRLVKERNPRTGESVLPWIEQVFYENGTRLSNFYVRGMSLSGPSWSMLDTGQHLRIKGNVEFDRYTQHPYDYLNFLPFWLGNAARKTGDMWGTTVLDELHIPLLLDAYGFDNRYQSFQLFQRGGRWTTLSQSLQSRITSRRPRDLVDEWFVGFDTRGVVLEQLERELIQNLADPNVRYLDYYDTSFDHSAHHNRDHATHRATLQALDGVVGRIWTAIQRTPQAAETTMVLLSDHGINSDERVYSQGFSLVNLLAKGASGGHHVVTKRRLLTDYSIKGIYPLVPLITTASNESPYLAGQSSQYPTALVDFDGNERASLHLRSSTLNVLHILLTQLQRRGLSPDLRRAAVGGIMTVLDRERDGWRRTAADMRQELAALQRAIDRLRLEIPPVPDKKAKDYRPETNEEIDLRIRQTARLENWIKESAEYTAYLATLERLASLTPADLAGPLKLETVIAPHAMGERNSIADLAHYVVGPADGGLVLTGDGALDFERSFRRVDYFALLNAQRVRNNVQAIVTNKPVDFTATRVPCRAIASDADAAQAETCVWLNGGADAQALILGRTDAARTLQLRYLALSHLAQDDTGAIRFTPLAPRAGLPLRLWEDPDLSVPSPGDRDSWFAGWHSDLEWLTATYRTRYSNAVIGIHEQFANHDAADADAAATTTDDTRLLRRYRLRQRALVEPDIVIAASDHWNFDVRGFNPGGNHGSFFRSSTHATLMFAGGDRTGIARGLDVQAPYDSLSFVPTVLTLTGELERDGRPSPALREKGFQPMPGRVIQELVPATVPVSGDPSF